MFFKKITVCIYIFFLSFSALAEEKELVYNYNIKIVIILIFLINYICIIFEDFIKLKKAEVSIFFSSVMLLILSFFSTNDFNFMLNHFLKAYCELFLFLLVVMIYINCLKNSFFFDFIKSSIMLNKFSLKKIYFVTGLLSFFISPFADNLTTALVMTSIILHISTNKSFVNLSCINIVVASNAGGVFSPFGDITTLMIWQAGVVEFFYFFKLFLPSFVSFLIPSIIMSFYIKNEPVFFFDKFHSKLSLDAKCILFLFFFTVFLAVFFQSYLNISSVFGIMFGFCFLNIYFFIRNKAGFTLVDKVGSIEWETLFFFYGIMLSIMALDIVGIIKDFSYFLYFDTTFLKDKTMSNIVLGLLSAIIDNIPITFLILNMKIDMCSGQWLLLTYTVATGGSLLSIGSAAGVAVMGKAKNIYTFYSHLKWSWAIFIGYVIGIFVHMSLNSDTFY